VSNLKQLLFRRCKRFSPNLSIISLVVRELHLPEVEGVVMDFMEGFPGQNL
jgi:hypothetical protein